MGWVQVPRCWQWRGAAGVASARRIRGCTVSASVDRGPGHHSAQLSPSAKMVASLGKHV